MPLVRISTERGLGSDKQAKISEAIQSCIEHELKAPPDDKFQIFSSHENNLIFDRNYMNVKRSDDVIFIQVFLKAGRTADMKKAFYKKLCARLSEMGRRPEDVFITLVENEAIDWSFGNGLAQLES
jgi:4-oxalocrotonate tautomerase